MQTVVRVHTLFIVPLGSNQFKSIILFNVCSPGPAWLVRVGDGHERLLTAKVGGPSHFI